MAEYQAYFSCTRRSCNKIKTKHYKTYHNDKYYKERAPKCSCGGEMKFDYTNPTM